MNYEALRASKHLYIHQVVNTLLLVCILSNKFTLIILLEEQNCCFAERQLKPGVPYCFYTDIYQQKFCRIHLLYPLITLNTCIIDCAVDPRNTLHKLVNYACIFSLNFVCVSTVHYSVEQQKN